MTSRGQIGRGDLVAALLHVRPASAFEAILADLLGFERKSSFPPLKKPEPRLPFDGPDEEVTLQFEGQEPKPVPFFVASKFYPTAFTQTAKTSESSRGTYAGNWQGRPDRIRLSQPLADWRDLRPILTTLLREEAPGRQVDIEEAVRRIARAELLDRIPIQQSPSWPSSIAVIVDRSSHLAPYFNDQRQVLGALAECNPQLMILPIVFRELDETFLAIDGWSDRPVSPQDLGIPCLVLGDLGGGAVTNPALSRIWSSLGTALGRGRGRGRGRVLTPTGSVHADCQALWRVVRWSGREFGPSLARAVLQKQVDDLLVLLSPAVRVCPGLIRDMRREFLQGADSAVEMHIWQSDKLDQGSSVATSFQLKQLKPLRERFQSLPPRDRIRALEIIRSWRADLHETLWYEEIVGLDPVTRAQLKERHSQDVDDALEYFADLAERGTSTELDIDTRIWLREAAARASVDGQAFEIREFRRAVELLPEVPAAEEGTPAGDVGRVAVRQQGEHLEFGTGEGGAGSLIGFIESANGRIEVAPHESTLPPWAKAEGADGMGRWIDVEFAGVSQRMRWCPPGRFMMGSPENEGGRFNDEGPQIEITFQSGFWMFDTAVTQALWTAVMGENPSGFKGPARPVENVSWYEASDFIDKLNAARRGLDLRLPSEAEWEYACRAGTSTRYAFGDEADSAQIHFDAEETSDVTAKPPNEWGLYQMHGNVEEWCADIWRESHEGADPGGAPRQSSEAGPEGQRRVVRGGSWGNAAQGVRAAYRLGYDPGGRDVYLGFRLARGQVSSGTVPEARPASAAVAGAAAPHRSPVAARPKVLVRRGAAPVRLPFPAGPFIVKSDRAWLEITETTFGKIDWASALGRDRFGLWADVEIGRARPRLRWIPPGRFVMGSPEDEPGRWGNEGPQTDITFRYGFWLMDAPVTQALWTEVLGVENNPSEFVSPDRPVENVSFDDCARFLKVLDDKAPGLDLHLPSESAWSMPAVPERGRRRMPVRWISSEKTMRPFLMRLPGMAGTAASVSILRSTKTAAAGRRSSTRIRARAPDAFG